MKYIVKKQMRKLKKERTFALLAQNDAELERIEIELDRCRKILGTKEEHDAANEMDDEEAIVYLDSLTAEYLQQVTDNFSIRAETAAGRLGVSLEQYEMFKERIIFNTTQDGCEMYQQISLF